MIGASAPSARRGRNSDRYWHDQPHRWLAAGLAVTLLSLPGCAGPPAPRSYLALPLRGDGTPAHVPLVVEGRICGARVMLVGTVHNRNPLDPQYARIEALYRRFAPTLILHENVTPTRPATDRNVAIQRDGAIGFVQVLAAPGGVGYRSGDLPERDEFKLLIGENDPARLLVFLTGQRLLVGLNDEAAVAAEYPGFYRDYLVANGFPYRESWSTWAGFKTLYREVMGADYAPSTFDPGVFSPIRDLGPLNEISRRAHRARDQRLLDEMNRGASQGHQRIMVVFGAWHVLALEPLIRAGGRCGPASRLTQWTAS